MTFSFRNILFFIGVTLLSSCETVVDFEFDEEPKLVVHSLFTPGDVTSNSNNFDVQVFQTKSILEDNSLEHLRDADVTITPFEQEEQVLSFLTDDSPFYRTTSGPEEGKSYELHVSREGNESVIAKSYVPVGTPIENLTFSEVVSFPHDIYPATDEYNFNLQFEIEDDIEENNFYHLIVWRVFEPTFSNNREVFQTVSYDELESAHDPSVQIVNTNRAFFGAHISDESFNGEKKKFDFNMAFNESVSQFPTKVRIEVELRTVSEDYYRYQIEGARYTNNGSNTFFNDQTTISNNIENGYGLFAGYSVRAVRSNLEQ